MKILHTADLHLNHPRVPSTDTISDLRKVLFPLITEVDLLIIGGDTFDCSVSLNSSDASSIISFFADLLRLCFEADTMIRILLGTRSHDLDQLRIITKLYQKLGIPVNYDSVSVIAVEYIKRYDTSILYIPDNMPYKNKREMFKHIHDLLKANNRTSVDYVVGHGTFDFTNFGHIDPNAYRIQDFNKICDKLGLFGHIHKPQKHGIIIYGGSFNRLAHGEEEKKGCWVIDGSNARFIENKYATKFVTVDYTGVDDLDQLVAKHQSILVSFNPDRISYLRVIMTDIHLKQILRKYHLDNYPNVKLTFKSTVKCKDSESGNYLDDKLKTRTDEVLIIPSSGNIANIVAKHVATNLGIELSLNIIESILNE